MDQSSELLTTKGAVKSQTTTALPNFIQDHDKGLPKNEIPPTVFNFFYFIYFNVFMWLFWEWTSFINVYRLFTF